MQCFSSLELGDFPAHHGPSGACCGMKAWLQPPRPGAQAKTNRLGKVRVWGLGFRLERLGFLKAEMFQTKILYYTHTYIHTYLLTYLLTYIHAYI